MVDWYYATFGDLLTEVERTMIGIPAQREHIAPLFWEMVDHHFAWDMLDANDRNFGRVRNNASGKKFRPLLVLLVAKALSGDYIRALSAAAAIELVHNFTLVHDDIMDKSYERRHRATLWAKWGIGQAVNAGDGIYTLGMASVFQLLKNGTPQERVLDVISAILDACVDTVEGQILDVSFETRDDVSTAEYITMVTHKSASLIGCSSKIGALLSTTDAMVVEAYRIFGEKLGIAFQIWDDYLGIWGEPSDTGKSATSDIIGKKKSYPILVAFERADATIRERLFNIYSQPELTPTDVEVVLDILESVSAKDFTKRLIDQYFDEALFSLHQTGVNNETQQQIQQLAEFFVTRSY